MHGLYCLSRPSESCSTLAYEISAYTHVNHQCVSLLPQPNSSLRLECPASSWPKCTVWSRNPRRVQIRSQLLFRCQARIRRRVSPHPWRPRLGTRPRLDPRLPSERRATQDRLSVVLRACRRRPRWQRRHQKRRQPMCQLRIRLPVVQRLPALRRLIPLLLDWRSKFKTRSWRRGSASPRSRGSTMRKLGRFCLT